MSVTFGGKYTDSLASLRYNIFSKTAKACVTPERLPPTASSTKFHSLRVYYQIMVWTQQESDMDPLDWGWKLQEGKLVPMMSTMKAAPATLLKVIHCNCASGCSTSRCSCRKYGLPCSAACGPCQLESCDNPNKEECDDDDS